MSDLIERLRDTHGTWIRLGACGEAADEIERLQARVDALEGALEQACKLIADFMYDEYGTEWRSVEDRGDYYLSPLHGEAAGFLDETREALAATEQGESDD